MEARTLEPRQVIGRGEWLVTEPPSMLAVHGHWAVAVMPRRYRIAVVDLATGELLREARFKSGARGLCTAVSRPIAFVGHGPRIIGWNLPDLSVGFEHEGTAEVRHLAVDAAGERLLVAEDKKTYVVEVATGAVRALKGHPPTFAVHLSDDGKLAVTFGRPYSAKVHDTAKGKVLKELPGQGMPKHVFALAGGKLGIFSSIGIGALDLETGKTLWAVGGARAAAAADVGERVLLAAGASFHVADAATGKTTPEPVKPGAELGDRLTAMASWHARGHVVVADQNRLRVISCELADVAPAAEPHAGIVHGLFPTPEGLVSVGGTSARRWNAGLTASELLRDDLPPEGRVGGIDHAHGLLAWQTDETTIMDLRARQAPLIVPKDGSYTPHDVRVHPAEPWLLRVGPGKFVTRITAAGTSTARAEVGTEALQCGAFLSADRAVVAGAAGGFLLDMSGWCGEASGAPGVVTKLEKREDTVSCIAILGPDHAVAGGNGGSLTVWDLRTGAARELQPGHRQAAYSRVAASADGRHVAALNTMWSDHVELWDIRQGKLLGTWSADDDVATSLSFLGPTLVLGTARGRLLVLDLP